MHKSRTLGLGALATCLLSSPLAAQDDCEVTRQLSTTLDAGGADRVLVIGRTGSLRIVGRQGLAEVRVTGEACASRSEILDQIEIIAERNGAEAHVEAFIPESRFGFLRSDYARLDLVVEVPEALALEVTDGSGAIEISEVRNAITVNDGSGALAIRNSTGEVRVRDGSGGMTIESVRGTVTVEDGSGAIEIRDVTGNVRIREDGSGAIAVDRVSGDFELGDDGSGGRSIGRIGGAVSLPRR